MTGTRLILTALATGVLTAGGAAGEASAQTYIDSPSLVKLVKAGKLPPVAKRLPETPRTVKVAGDGRVAGRHGGTLRMLMGRSKDTRIMTVYGYARLVVFNEDYDLVPDITEKVEVVGDREFTFTLRRGHRWSTGKPFTARDFEFFWKDVANNKCIYSFGLPNNLLVNGEPPTVEIVDERTIKYSWTKPNPYFLPALAGPSPLYIYMPFHYLKKFHPKYSKKVMKKWKKAQKKGQTCGKWARKFRKRARQYRFQNIKLPVLQPWINTTKSPAERFVFRRNPYFHRVDQNGRQLPYVDRVLFLIADSKIIPAKTGAGESDLQGRYLRFSDFTFLKRSELRRKRFTVRQWKAATGAHIALYPNLNHKDPVWRKLFQDARFRRALSLAINRREINEIMYYGLAEEGANTVVRSSPLFRESYLKRWHTFDIARANKLLDDIGLTKRDAQGYRLLPDGRRLEIIVEAASEGTEYSDVMGLIQSTWARIGVRLFQKSTRREMFRRRVYAGLTHISLWSGLDYANLRAAMPPDEMAPTAEIQLQWPKWGLWYESRGRRGARPTLPKVVRLLELLKAWRATTDRAERTKIWHEILSIHADQVYTIGIIGGVLQPIVVNKKVRNVPAKGIWAWDPGARFGIYGMDTFWLDNAVAGQRAATGGKK